MRCQTTAGAFAPITNTPAARPRWIIAARFAPSGLQPVRAFMHLYLFTPEFSFSDARRRRPSRPAKAAKNSSPQNRKIF
jgi:hypothetical protein